MSQLPEWLFKVADEARTAYLRDVDCNDQIGALSVALEVVLRPIRDAAFNAGLDYARDEAYFASRGVGFDQTEDQAREFALAEIATNKART